MVFKKIKPRLGFIFSIPVLVCASLGSFLTQFVVPKNVLLDYLEYPSVSKISIQNIAMQWSAIIQEIKSLNNYKIGMVLALFYFFIIAILMNSFFIYFYTDEYSD